MSIGFTEIIVIVLFVLLIFGAKRIPELARALGRAKYEFQKAKRSLETESEELLKTAEKNAELADQRPDSSEIVDAVEVADADRDSGKKN